MRITRYPNLNEQQFLGCVAAFVDSLTGELNAAALALRRLEGEGKGRAFAYEMALDQHRYGALIVLDRWSTLTGAFGPHLELSRSGTILSEAAARVRSAEELLARTNALIDGAASYAPEVVQACSLAWQSVGGVFEEERAEAEQAAKLGPMQADDYKEARQIFLQDLAAR